VLSAEMGCCSCRWQRTMLSAHLLIISAKQHVWRDQFPAGDTCLVPLLAYLVQLVQNLLTVKFDTVIAYSFHGAHPSAVRFASVFSVSRSDAASRLLPGFFRSSGVLDN
jgi:hypothetical protein